MHRLTGPLLMFLVLAITTSAQFGKSVSVAAGTPEDKALAEIYAAPDGPDKIALLDKFMADYGKGDLALLGDQLYVQSYLAQKNYPKVYEYGDKALALDPNNFSTAVSMVHAAEEQGDATKVYDESEKVAAILARYKAAPAPEGLPADRWSTQKEATLKNAEGDIITCNTPWSTPPTRPLIPPRAPRCSSVLSRIFPDSTYATTVREQTAVAYQQAHNQPKMLATAQSLLTSDPDNISMLLLLADTWCNDPHQVDKAAADAQKALDLLAQAKKPDNVADDQWQKQISLQKGLAYSSLGEANVNKGRNPQAIDNFKQAAPLLKSDNFSYAQNQYRLGFTLAKLKRIPEARTVLTEVLAYDTPYKQLAKDTLDKIGGPVSNKPAHKKS